jgi:hypothetical protein
MSEVGGKEEQLLNICKIEKKISFYVFFFDVQQNNLMKIFAFYLTPIIIIKFCSLPLFLDYSVHI